MGTVENGEPIPTKKRRLQGACDICRTKKIRCDSAIMPGMACSNCVAFGSKCTHVLASKGKNKTAATFTDEQSQWEPLNQDATYKVFNDYSATRTKVASILSPSNAYAIPESQVTIRQTLVELARYIQVLEAEVISNNPSSASSSSLPSIPPDHNSYADADAKSLEVNEDIMLSDQMKLLTVSQSHARFYGKSSNLSLVQAAIDIRKSTGTLNPEQLNRKRPEYWTVHPWQWIPEEEPPMLVFPEPDLLEELIELYFVNSNTFLPIFHKPTFKMWVDQGLHFDRKSKFGAVLLAVCAVASRYSNDPRIFVEDAGTEQSSGWKWFSQVRPVRTSFVTVPTLFEIQLYCVCVMYLQGTSTPEACWTLTGVAVRMIQDIGAHRRNPGETKRTVDSELWRRTFWAVIVIDILIAAFLGRPRATHPEDYDQDLPAECDDEYWETEDPADAFKQPPGKPSIMSHFVCFIKLLTILGIAQRTIYAVNKTDPWSAESKFQQDNQVILKIDSALNEWLDLVPEHIRWDPHRENQTFFDQSAVLYVTYYHVQILVHKPFIRCLPGNKDLGSDMYFPSMAICANAARSCTHVMDVQSRRGFIPLPNVHMGILSSAIVLLLNHWGGRRLGLLPNPGKGYSDVYKCIGILRLYESRWQVCGRSIDLLQQLLSIGTSTAEINSSAKSLKRQRNSDDEQRESNCVPQAKKPAILIAVSSPETDQNPQYSLPFYTKELGQLPIYGTFDFDQDSWFQTAPRHSLASANLPPPTLPPTLPYGGQDSEFAAIIESMNYAQPESAGVHLASDTMDNETMDIWSRAPSGYDWENWGAYLSNLEELMQASNT